MNDYLVRYVYDDNLFDAYEVSCFSLLTATGIQSGQLLTSTNILQLYILELKITNILFINF
jgi:hypothetical protein